MVIKGEIRQCAGMGADIFAIRFDLPFNAPDLRFDVPRRLKPFAKKMIAGRHSRLQRLKVVRSPE